MIKVQKEKKNHAKARLSQKEEKVTLFFKN